MTAIQYLQQIKRYDYIIANKVKEYRHWVEVADGMGGFSAGERVKSSRNLQKGANAINNYIDVEREIKELKRKRQEMIDVVQKLSPIEYDILYKLYIEGYVMKELASEYHKSYAWVKEKKRKALAHLQEILDKSSQS